MRLKRASFCEIGVSWPWHIAQPTGAKLPPNIRISPIYGWDILFLLSLILRWEDAAETNDAGEHQIRLHVVVRLVPADGRHRGRIDGRRIADPTIEEGAAGISEEFVRRIGIRPDVVRAIQLVSVLRHFRLNESVVDLTASLPLNVTLPDVDARLALQVR